MEKALSPGNGFDLIILDEHFGMGRMLGSSAIDKIRARSSGKEVIISCTGNAFDNIGGRPAGVDAVWGKPLPNWADGTMRKELATLIDRKRNHARPNGTC